MRIYDSIRPTLSDLLENPCNNCLIRAACQNFECPKLEEYLTIYYKTIPTLSSKEIEIYNNKIPFNFKTAMNYFNKVRDKKISNAFFVFTKDNIHKIIKTPDDIFRIKKIKR